MWLGERWMARTLSRDSRKVCQIIQPFGVSGAMLARPRGTPSPVSGGSPAAGLFSIMCKLRQPPKR